MKLKNITLEMSLKPFLKTDDAFVRDVCRELFLQWRPLIKDADSISVLLWTSDGSELLDYDGCENTAFEWAYWIGNANAPEGSRSASDPRGVGLHHKPWIYTEKPAKMTYGILKRIVETVKEVGREMMGVSHIRVGTTFDIGPEFAKSDFKYNRHNEICTGNTIGVASFVCSYATLHGDQRRYAGYPGGIPEGLPFGSFFGRQSQYFMTDMGFDYLWLSNGLGFGRDTWSATGAVFDGDRFCADGMESVKESVLSFWRLFRAECPNFPIETRGTNMTMGIDLASDGVPLKDIYEGGFNLLPPPNSPWAALDSDFGLELAGYMSRIAELPEKDFLFRYYLHDPWWVNSPWYDRYNGQPHDIYLPLAVSRIDEDGKIGLPNHLNFLTVDNSYGELPEKCVHEVIPHIRKGFEEAPDAPAPLVWVYPFEEYSACDDSQEVMEIFSGDWFIRSCINNGTPLSSVVSTTNFVGHDKKIYASSVLVTPVPKADSAFENTILDYLKNGGRVVFYGNTLRASEKFKTLVGVKNTHGVSGELPLTLDGKSMGIIKHVPIIGGGEITEESTKDNAVAFAGEKVIMTAGENFVWLRGVTSNEYKKGSKRLLPQDESKYFIADRLMLRALEVLGYSFSFERVGRKPLPVLMIHRHDNAYIFSQFTPNTSVEVQWKMPLGAPILNGYEAVMKEGCATYRLPRAERRECRVFVEQEDGVVSCSELYPCSAVMRRRIRVGGLKNATVRFLAEDYCRENVDVRLNTRESACQTSDPVFPKYVTKNGETYCEVTGVTGTLVFSMPMKKQRFFEK
ncbi:MAG: hypothetical protein E7629_01420 [Ruminococcaceae bacterium]|nr:hypothetical protein [Oscillospiraceae bacterium]